MTTEDYESELVRLRNEVERLKTELTLRSGIGEAIPLFIERAAAQAREKALEEATIAAETEWQYKWRIEGQFTTPGEAFEAAMSAIRALKQKEDV